MMILEMNILTLHLNGELKKTIACVYDELNNQVTDDGNDSENGNLPIFIFTLHKYKK